ncbi:hypothetical protein HELRODRAFT_169454 [Helobdella robusta]|uniref:Apple domain-containing protein n=1 Tax=Helobdella robusta TaxID=6412 RepID=T1F1Y7_HELRO|nr:hypothetical protein HELRODRAFT_169454 [Helobdella robusta]ESO08579.1 hypothetical protein HELRODRAFT_169454 [Helobdella robusta]
MFKKFLVLLLCFNRFSLVKLETTSGRFARCRGQSNEVLCCADKPDLIATNVESVTKCSAHCAGFDGNQLELIRTSSSASSPPFNSMLYPNITYHRINSELYSCEMHDLHFNLSILPPFFTPANACDAFNYFSTSALCYLYAPRTSYNASASNATQCSFYQTLTNAETVTTCKAVV